MDMKLGYIPYFEGLKYNNVQKLGDRNYKDDGYGKLLTRRFSIIPRIFDHTETN